MLFGKLRQIHHSNFPYQRFSIDIVSCIFCFFRMFPDHFNESVMFNGGAQSQLLKNEFRQHFRNISRIMDCVGCDKCKLWGKLQIQGLGTALKILFSGKFDTWTVGGSFDRKHFFLERSEIVALVNSFGRFVFDYLQPVIGIFLFEFYLSANSADNVELNMNYGYNFKLLFYNPLRHGGIAYHGW